MNSEFDWGIERNETNSSLLRGLSAFLRASTFSWSGIIPSLGTMTPQNGTSGVSKMHFSGLNVMPISSAFLKTASTTKSCYSFVGAAMIMSSGIKCTC